MNLNAVNACISSFLVFEYHDAGSDVGPAVAGEVGGYRKLLQPRPRSEPDLLAPSGNAALGRDRTGDGLFQPFRELRHAAHAQPQKVSPGAAVQARGHRHRVSLHRAKQKCLVVAALAGVDVGGELVDRRNGPRQLNQFTLVPQPAQKPAETDIRHDSSVDSTYHKDVSAGSSRACRLPN